MLSVFTTGIRVAVSVACRVPTVTIFSPFMGSTLPAVIA
jgi:hypothetical protein